MEYDSFREFSILVNEKFWNLDHKNPKELFGRVSKKFKLTYFLSTRCITQNSSEEILISSKFRQKLLSETFSC